MIRLRWIYADCWRGLFNLRMSESIWKMHIILPNYLVHFLNFYKKDKTIVWVCLVIFRTKLDTSDIRHITTTYYISYTRHSCNMGLSMITSSNGNIFRVTGPLCGEFISHQWIPLPKANNAELRCFLEYYVDFNLVAPGICSNNSLSVITETFSRNKLLGRFLLRDLFLMNATKQLW